ncbi:MAG TPA: cytochrome c [Acetobacteraceae bacterium]|nr:cytochrome c [Acetobacteraceae bacterium]
MNSLRLALLAITAAGALGVARADEAAFNIIETRQAGQDLLSATYSGIREGVAHKVPVKAFDKSAAAMARWMTQFPTTFPPGSDHGNKTRALPAIWSDRPGFEKAAANLVAAADKLAQLAKADDTAGFTAQVKTVGDACTACHNKFRAK